MVGVGGGAQRREKDCTEAETRDGTQERGDGGGVEETESQTEGPPPRAEDGRKEWEKTPSNRERPAAAA